MDWVKLIIAVVSAVGTFLATGVPALVKLSNAVKERRAAVEEAEKEKATNDMLHAANNFIEAAEKTFAGFDTVMKAQNGSAGALKKDTVLTKLQAYAMSNGYTFDEEYWSQKIDNIVAMTKEVNAAKK